MLSLFMFLLPFLFFFFHALDFSWLSCSWVFLLFECILTWLGFYLTWFSVKERSAQCLMWLPSRVANLKMSTNTESNGELGNQIMFLNPFLLHFWNRDFDLMIFTSLLLIYPFPLCIHTWVFVQLWALLCPIGWFLWKITDLNYFCYIKITLQQH